jgi:uncharacterized protein YbbC (DUF1343 family)
MLKYYILVISLIGLCNSPDSKIEIPTPAEVNQPEIIPGAYHMDQYLDLLKDKSIGVVVNQTSVVHDQHLVDLLLDKKINIKAIFAPEHGFKGDADAGETIKDGKYLSRIPLFSLYGATKKPLPEMLEGIDVLVFDIQDVGVRFYTYISTLHYVMEAAAEQDIPVILLDRPNPNGHYVDGPIMEDEYKSFVGMHPVPIVYGMTIGEYGQMINGQKWLTNGATCGLTVIPCTGYNHNSYYSLPIPPSPNLPNDRSILLYPSLCLFEGTTISVGRGTDQQFQVIGHPEWKNAPYQFTPVSTHGSKNPLYENKVCHGQSFLDMNPMEIWKARQLNFDYLLKTYQNLKANEVQFFNKNNFFEKLAGTDQLRKQIIEGKSMIQIRESWTVGLAEFHKIRSKYLIYD